MTKKIWQTMDYLAGITRYMSKKYLAEYGQTF